MGQRAPLPFAGKRIGGTLDTAIETFRGVVNTWECDEMGHMNVRFYVARAMDGLASLALRIGLSPSLLRDGGLRLAPRDQHLRFHRELRPGNAIKLRCVVVKADPSELTIYQELVRADDGALCASTMMQVGLYDSDQAEHQFGDSVLTRARELESLIPKHGLPRGLVLRPRSAALSLDQAVQQGLHAAYRGVVRDEDCDRDGVMRTEWFMGRISDGIPHLFQAVGGLARDPEQGVGGAALEYRLVYRERPRAGDILEMRSALRAQRDKTYELCNFLFNAETGVCVLSSDAVAVMFDMRTRKAVAPPLEVTERLSAYLKPGLLV